MPEAFDVVRLERRARSWPLLLVVLAAVGCGGAQTEPGEPTTPTFLPATPLWTLDGRSESLAQLARGRVVLIDLWATWCDACLRRLSEVDDLARSYAASGLLVVGVDVGEDAETVQSFLRQQPLSYPVYLDPEFAWADALNERRIPRLLLVDARGRIVHRATKLDAASVETLNYLLTQGGARPAHP